LYNNDELYEKTNKLIMGIVGKVLDE